MTTTTTPGRARPEAIRAVPVRHPWRWVTVALLALLTAMFVHMLVTNRNFEWFTMVNHMFRPPIIVGLRGTILLTVFAMIIGVLLGVVFAVMRLSPNPILSTAAFLYTWFFRSVPRLVLCILFGNLGILWSRMEFGLPFDTQIGALFGVHEMHARLFGVSTKAILTGFTAGLLALGLSEGAYMAEIVRAGIQSVDEGQSRAAEALGMTRGQVMRRVILPQSMRVIIPPTGNETIAMLKDTSLVAFVPVNTELFFQLNAVTTRIAAVLPMLVAATLWYLFLTSILLVGQHFLEKRFSRGYGTAQKARMRLRDLSIETGGRPVAVPDVDRRGAP